VAGGRRKAVYLLSFRRHYRRGGGLYGEFKRSTFFSIDGQEEAERTRPSGAPVEPQKHNVSAVKAGNVDLLLDVVGSWWLMVPEGASVALGVRTPKGG